MCIGTSGDIEGSSLVKNLLYENSFGYIELLGQETEGHMLDALREGQ